jgi:hypothetical protein
MLQAQTKAKSAKTCLAMLLVMSGSSCSAFYMHRLPKHEFAAKPALYEDVPVVVEEALSVEEVDQWLNKVLTHAKNEDILVQFGKDQSTATMPLKKATALAVEHSSHEAPIYISSIGKTSSPMFSAEVPVNELRESLFVNEHTKQDDTLDWFAAIKEYAPVHDTLIVAGEGSTSPVLQCHAYSKLQLCIDGSQLIRILPPLGEQPNDILRDLASPTYMEAQRGFPVSNGYRANPKHDLFSFRHRDVSWELEQLEKTHGEGETKHSNRYDQLFQHWAEDPNVFHPNFEVQGANPDANIQNHHDLWHSTVLLPGDMVVIPPGWWYQTYNVEPSVTLSTQRCGGSEMACRFIHHALETSGVDRMLQLNKDGRHTMEEALTIVSGLFEVLDEHYSSAKNGGRT